MREFKKAVKHWLIDTGTRVEDIADMVGTSKAFVYAVINGDKNIPDSWILHTPNGFTQLVLDEKIRLAKKQLEGLTSMRKSIQ